MNPLPRWLPFAVIAAALLLIALAGLVRAGAVGWLLNLLPRVE